jgi:O-antigen/teichoic acid export membrane protein
VSWLRTLLHRQVKVWPASITGVARSTILGSLSLSGAQVAVTGLFALAGLYLVRSLSTHEYGRAAYGLNIHLLLLTVAGLGLTTGVMAEIARGRRSAGVSWSTVHSLFVVRAISVVPVLLVGLLWAEASSDLLPFVASVTASLFIVMDFLIGVLAAEMRTQSTALVIICQPVWYVLLLVFLSVSTAEGVLVALGAALAVSLAVAAVLLAGRTLRWIRWPRVTFGPMRHAIGVARFAYVMVLLQIGFFVLPIILLGSLERYTEAASLSIVLTLVRVVPEALALAVIWMYYPRLNALDPLGREARALFHTFAGILAFVAVPAALGLAIVGGPLLAVLFADRYVYLAPYLAIGSVLVLLLPAESMLNWTLLSRGEGRIAVAALTIRLVVVLVACLVFLQAAASPWQLALLLMAFATGAAASVVIQVIRARRTQHLPMAAGPLALYAGVTATSLLGVRVLLTGRVSDAIIIIAAGIVCLPVMAFGARILLRPEYVRSTVEEGRTR